MITTVPVHDAQWPVWLDRLVAALVLLAAVVCAALLVGVDPDARGHGTHTQLGLSACEWPQAYGIPCPTCGATTAAALLVHGRLLSAFMTQPFGAAFALAGLCAGAAAGYCLLRSRSFLDVYAQLPRTAIALGAGLLLLASWGYKCLVF